MCADKINAEADDGDPEDHNGDRAHSVCGRLRKPVARNCAVATVEVALNVQVAAVAAVARDADEAVDGAGAGGGGGVGGA